MGRLLAGWPRVSANNKYFNQRRLRTGVVSMQPAGHEQQTVCIPGQDAFVSELISPLALIFAQSHLTCSRWKPSMSTLLILSVAQCMHNGKAFPRVFPQRAITFNSILGVSNTPRAQTIYSMQISCHSSAQHELSS